ncbi:MAG TPA: bifunctional diguanylate cyclase/phosphodiesterase [Micromonosporaceae bacterium]
MARTVDRVRVLVRGALRAVDRLVPPGESRLFGRTSLVISLVGALVVVAGWWLGPFGVRGSAPTPTFGWVLAAVVTVVVAQVARLPVQLRSSQLSVAWGESALIVVLYLVPAGWAPGVVGLGVAAAMALRGVPATNGVPSSRLSVMTRNGATLALATAAAAGVAYLIHPPYRAGFSPTLAVSLTGAAAVYSGVGAALVARFATLRTGEPYLALVVHALRSKLLMIVGNVAVGLVIIAIVGVDLRWLALLPPILWLQHQAYAYRMRAGEESRVWDEFAQATRALNQLDERDVAAAAVTGAVRLFHADEVEVLVLRPDGSHRRYRGPTDDGVVEDEPGYGDAWRDDERHTSRVLLLGGVPVGELRLGFATPDPAPMRAESSLSAYADALAAALHDAAAHRRLATMTAESSHAALHDPLTGTTNRVGLTAKGNAALRALDRDAPAGLLLLDIDHFREVNDTLGHAAGDELLQVTAARLRSACRPGELLARLGGDEFAILLTELPRPAGEHVAALYDEEPVSDDGALVDTQPLGFTLRRARELADLVAAPTEVFGLQLAVEASVGVVVAPAGAVDMTELLRRADIAMYQAKRGGSSITWYDSSTDGASTDRLALLAELREALNSPHQLTVDLQPTVDLRDGTPTGIEALVRWQHPRRGVLAPAEFIEIVENSELIVPFTCHVLGRALAIAAEWDREGFAVPVSVNLSPRSLLDRQLPTRVAELLRRHGVPANRLILEITERVVVPANDVVTEVLGGLRAQGVRLAVDDFGTGYSSLTFLTRVQVDEVKVDQTFVARMVESAEAAAIVRTTVRLGRELGLRVVAEGVETTEQRRALTELGCDAAQGFHFFSPMSPEKALAAVREAVAGRGPRVIRLRTEDAS